MCAELSAICQLLAFGGLWLYGTYTHTRTIDRKSINYEFGIERSPNGEYINSVGQARDGFNEIFLFDKIKTLEFY